VVSWSSRFAEPISLPDGKTLASLGEAIAHLVKTVPAAERKAPAVLTAAKLLTQKSRRHHHRHEPGQAQEISALLDGRTRPSDCQEGAGSSG
jgi:hypothetical protein